MGLRGPTGVEMGTWIAQIEFRWGPVVRLGPTDSRDEASRLARSWLDSRGQAERDDHGGVVGVVITPADEAAAD